MQFTYPEIMVTKDGSHTLVNTSNQQLYHSIDGAILESKHVFIEHNLRDWLNEPPQEPINILELGFGSGLNAYLTRLEAERSNVSINYHTVELYPVHPDIAAKLNYSSELGQPDANSFMELHLCEWGQEKKLSDNFSINKVYGDFLKQDFPKERFHCFYYHAFAYDAQPELWTDELIDRIGLALKPKGIISSFSATGRLNRYFRTRSFIHEKPKGVGEKREITRAIK